MTRMTGSDYVILCNFVFTHTHTHTEMKCVFLIILSTMNKQQKKSNNNFINAAVSLKYNEAVDVSI